MNRKYSIEEDQLIRKYLFEYLMAEQLKAFIEVLPSDPLTQLPNRRFFVDELERFIKISERYDASISIAMIDLDAFTSIENKFGTAYSNQLLQTLAFSLKSAVRETDVLTFWGRDEFAWIMPETAVKGAFVAAEKLRRHLLEETFEQVGKISCSIGVAEYKSGEGLQDFIARARYEKEVAKSKGRNRVSTDWQTSHA